MADLDSRRADVDARLSGDGSSWSAKEVLPVAIETNVITAETLKRLLAAFNAHHIEATTATGSLATVAVPNGCSPAR